MIEKELRACQTSLVEDCLKVKLFLCEDIVNLYRPFDGKLLKPSVCVNCKASYPCLDSENGLCQLCFDDKPELQEIYEWWLVTEWFSTKLMMEGKPVLKNEYGTWWGRCTTGQAVSLDDVIQQLYDNLMT